MALSHAEISASILPASDPQWLALHKEEIIEPDIAIIDPHHHLWGLPRLPVYLQEAFAADLMSGHNIVATVFAECTEGYRTDGPERMQPVGETEFVTAFAEEAAQGPAGNRGICNGIIGRADLLEGASVVEVLEAHAEAGKGRFRGIRQSTAYDATGTVRTTARTPPPGILLDAGFRQGFEALIGLGMTFDSWVYHPQLGEVADLARSYPQANIILDHVGGPIGAGAYAGKRDEVFAIWKKGIVEIAACENVTCKLGGLGMKLGGFGFEDLPRPATSQMLAEAWAPYIETCIEAFGPERCMFESNFPVDMVTCSYAVLWNAFKRIVASYSNDEKTALFSATAKRVYSI